MNTLFYAIWDMMTEMAPYLLLGFLLAGLMHEFIPRKVYSKYLSKSNLRSVVHAALFGVPLPLCSCGVLPTAMGIRREGASRGATISFLIATPQTGIDSIIATFSLMGLPFAILRPIIALLTAVFGGALVNGVESGERIVESGERYGDKNGVACQEEKLSSLHSPLSTLHKKIASALHYGFVEMMGDIGKWLVVGLIVAGMITALVPDQWFALFKDNSMLSILLVLCISVPMYVCATGSIPIAVALMMKGLTPGAALVLLMAGPACNVASMLVINKVMGRRTLLLYLTAIVGGAVAFGLGIDYLLPREWFTSSLIMQGSCCNNEHLGWFSIASAFVLILLLVNALLHHDHHHESGESNRTPEGLRLARPRNGDKNGVACQEEKVSSLHSPLSTLHKESLHISGMHCSHCAANVERAIRSIEGVETVSVSLSDKSAKITGNFDEAAVRKAIEALGYEVAP